MQNRFRKLVAALSLAAVATSLVAAEGDVVDGDELAPVDYIAAKDQLSQPEYAELVTDVHRVMGFDGTDIYVEVTRPDPAVYGELELPVVMEISPYHGTIATRIGDRIFPDPKGKNGQNLGMTGYFAPRGYAVAMVDLRGTGRSGGCLDHLGNNDARDIKAVVEWAADAAWSNGRVGLTGHSYVGSTPKVAAAMKPRGLVTIAPSAGLASMYDHQFQMGVPYMLQWVGPMVAYEALALGRHLPPGTSTPILGGPNGDDWGNHVTDTGCGMTQSALLAGHGQVTGEYQAWHGERDWRDGAARADIPVFMIHGVNDNAARIPAAEWFFANRHNPQDKVWIGQWDHGSNFHPNGRMDQWMYALHAWFDRHLKGMDVDTGPSVEAFLNDGLVTTAAAWPKPTDTLTLYPNAATMTLDTAAPEAVSSKSLVGAAGRRKLEFRSSPFAADTTILGLPELDLYASVTGQAVHLVTTLWREDRFGRRTPMNTCAIQPQLRHGIAAPAPIVPGQQMWLQPQCFTMAHHVFAGDTLIWEVNTNGAHHVPTLAVDADIRVFTGKGKTAYTFPTHDGALYADVAKCDRDLVSPNRQGC